MDSKKITRVIQPKNTLDQKSKALLDPESIEKPKTWPKIVSTNVQKLRQSLQLNQEEFAHKLHLQTALVKNIENGKGNYDGKIIHTINRVFKTNISSVPL
jgi:DNA-binding transcriptional regulator YiaG